MATDIARDLRRIRLPRYPQPRGLLDAKAHAMLRAAGASTHGLAHRNYALIQLMLQTGLRVGEVAASRIADVTLHDRSGSVHVRHRKGLKHQEVPLNATARRALKHYLAERPGAGAGEPLFLSGRNSALPVCSIQAVISGIARRTGLTRLPVSAHGPHPFVSRSAYRGRPSRPRA